MAVLSNTNYYTNAIVGQMQLGANVDIHRVDLTPKYVVGLGFERADGAKFRYSQFGASNANRGVLVAPADVITNGGGSAVDIDQKAWASTQTTAPNGTTIAPNAIGSKYVWLTLSNVSDQQLAGGYFITTDDTGEGYTYRIKDNDTTGDVATGVTQLELYEPLVVGLGTTTDISIQACRYADLVTPAISLSVTASNCVVGVTCAGVSSTNYGWIQTRGVVGVLQGATVPVQGQAVMPSTNVSGAIVAVTVDSATGLFNTFQKPVVGYCIDPGDSEGHSVIQLMLE